jgi:hypothetical protein
MLTFVKALYVITLAYIVFQMLALVRALYVITLAYIVFQMLALVRALYVITVEPASSPSQDIAVHVYMATIISHVNQVSGIRFRSKEPKLIC